MHVELRPHKGMNLVTKREQVFEQYLVYTGHPEKLDVVGIIGWAEGSKLLYLVPMDPISKKEIDAKVSDILKREADAIAHPDIDIDLVNPPLEDTYDEFNESDLT